MINYLIKLAEKGKIPVSPTLLGIGGFPGNHILNMGWMGMHGNASANNAIQNADLLIACGMRFDDRVTGKLETYSPNSKKIHIDIDSSELNKNVKADVGIHGDLKSVIQELVKKIGNFDRSSWFNQIQKWQSEVENIEIINKSTKVYIAAQAIKNIWEGTEGNAVVVSLSLIHI